MSELRNFDDVRKALNAYIPAAPPKGNYTLDRMRDLMGYLGNPQDTYKVVHIAGTSGKTSTAYYMAALLRASGKRVGLTVSPHVQEVNERVQIDGLPLEEQRFCVYLSTFLELIKPSGIQPSYFELMVAFAYWVFGHEGVDYAVVEVGLGGLLDGTNVVSREDKVCILTDIGLDHTNLLGESIEQIAEQKAGITFERNHVFAYKQSGVIMKIFQSVADKNNASLVIVEESGHTWVNLPPFLNRNWSLAKKAYDFVMVRDNLNALNTEQLTETAREYIPARMEMIRYDDKTIILDGAHNEQKLTALLEGVRHLFPDQNAAVMFSSVKSSTRRLQGNLRVIRKMGIHVILTTFESQQDVIKTSASRDALLHACEDVGITSYEFCSDVREATKLLLARPEKVLIITGSFYLMNHVRPALIKETNK